MGIEKGSVNLMASNVDSLVDKKNDSGDGELVCEDPYSIKE